MSIPAKVASVQKISGFLVRKYAIGIVPGLKTASQLMDERYFSI